ncbi:MAG: hypothetical protein H6812_03610 [Phycisphaeraceae bacterium]|nr:hypothetical protein [Phycisphaeraceae bacterium]
MQKRLNFRGWSECVQRMIGGSGEAGPEQRAYSDAHPWSLDRPLLEFEAGDVWTIRDACAGTQIFGDTGSGKTTGSGQAIAKAMLRAGFGGLVLTVKSSETARWRRYMEEVGRRDDLVVFSPESDQRFNFLEYERARAGRGGGLTLNIAQLFVTVMNAGSGKGVGTSDPFWDRALMQLMNNAIDAIRLGGASLSISNLLSVIQSAPQSAGEAESDDWKRESFLFDLLVNARETLESTHDLQDLSVTTRYWLSEFARSMDPDTRGNIVSTFTTLADGFLRGTLREMFCTEVTITPEATLDGRVIVIDLPSKQFMETGRLAQILWMICWQRAVEAAGRGPESRPVFLWADEAQNFITPGMADFVQTVRESKAACVFLTQARSNYLHALGSQHVAGVESFLGIVKTKIFHCNGDPETNEWAQRVISEDWRQQVNYGQADGQSAKKGLTTPPPNRSMNIGLHRMARVFASEFGGLRCGGPPEYAIDAVLFQSGRCFAGGDGNVLRLTFDQDTSCG